MQSVVKAGGANVVSPVSEQFATSTSVIKLPNGKLIVAWTGHQNNKHGVFQQMLNADGTKSGEQTKVNATESEFLGVPQIAALSNGKWVVVWASGEPNRKVFQQVYNADGTKSGNENLISETAANSHDVPSITALDDGKWVVAWHASNMEDAGDNNGVFQQVFNADASKSGQAALVNSTVAGGQVTGGAAKLSDGGWIVAWSGNGADDTSGVFQQVYNADGSKRGGEVPVNSTSEADQFGSRVTVLSNGKWVVTWQGKGPGDDNGVFQQVFNADGSKSGGEILVNTTVVGENGGATATALDGGKWVVTWEGNGPGDDKGIFQQAFNADGSKIGGATLINTQTDGHQRSSSTVYLSNDEWLVVWGSDLLEAGAEVIQQRMKLGNIPDDVRLSKSVVAESAVNGTEIGLLSTIDADSGDTFTYTLVDNAGGRFAVDGNKLTVANGVKLDYEQAKNHSITVRATDSSGLSVTKSLTLGVADVAFEKVRGSAGDDKLVGGNKADKFQGMGGNDILKGGLGSDVLAGGAGKDIFVFDTKPNRKRNLDKITDFSVKDDTIWLDNAVFKTLGKGSEAKPGKLDKKFFKFSHLKQDKDDYLVYSKKTGMLSYDADGWGKAKAIEVAQLSKNLKMTAADFFVV